MAKVFDGVGPEAETVTLDNGAKQSKPAARLDLIPQRALMHVGKILDEGAKKYGEDNWKGIPTKSHINKALIHLAAYLSGDTQDDHIGHACCRLQMALERHLMDQDETPPAQQSNKLTEYIEELKEWRETVKYLVESSKQKPASDYYESRLATLDSVIAGLEAL